MGKRREFMYACMLPANLCRSHLMLSDGAVEDGAYLARNNLFTLVLKTCYAVRVLLNSKMRSKRVGNSTETF